MAGFFSTTDDVLRARGEWGAAPIDRRRLVRLIGNATEWETLDSYLMEYLAEPEMRNSARASTLSASLELVREGTVELKQREHFAPLYVRRRLSDAAPLAEAANG